jgi:PQQ-like domain
VEVLPLAAEVRVGQPQPLDASERGARATAPRGETPRDDGDDPEAPPEEPLRAVDARPADERAARTRPGEDARIPGEPVYRGHTLIARRANGRVAWRFRGDGYLDSSPLIAGRWAFVGSGSGRVYALDVRTGRVRSRADAGASVLRFLAAGEGLLLVPARGRLVAFG